MSPSAPPLWTALRPDSVLTTIPPADVRAAALALRDDLLAGKRAALGRALSEVERLTPVGRELLATLPSVEPIIIGWTGSPGAGKSSLIDALVAARRAAKPDRRIAVLAVDPSSPITGGSVLGDRVRMDRHTLDEGVYIRSLAARGALGGLSPAALRSARLLAAAGFAEVHLETVGVGQNDVAVADLADTVVLVSVPNAGDRIQAIKAGVLEVADLFAVNKCDLDGAPAAVAALELAATERRGGWRPRALAVSARAGTGIEDLARLLDEHAAAMKSSGARGELVRTRRLHELRELVLARWEQALAASPDWSAAATSVADGAEDPVAAAERLWAVLARPPV